MNIDKVRGGLLHLDHYAIKALDHANEAVTYAAANAGPFNVTMIRP